MKTPTTESEVIQLFIEKKLENAISKSPYSNSFYICENSEDAEKIDWNNKPANCYRISNHWNFININECIDCCLKGVDKKSGTINKVLLAKWDKEQNEYIEILELSEEFMKSLYYLNDFDYLISDISSIENFIKRNSPRFKFNERPELTFENGLNVLKYHKSLELKDAEIFKKQKKREQEELLLKISKNTKLKNKLIELLDLDKIKMLEQGNRKYKKTELYSNFKKFEYLFEKISIENTSVRKGKLHDFIVFNKAEQKRIYKKLMAL